MSRPGWNLNRGSNGARPRDANSSLAALHPLDGRGQYRAERVPRNAPCPCGSEVKAKRCCLAAGGPERTEAVAA